MATPLIIAERVAIIRLPTRLSAPQHAQIDAIFFAASATQSFPSEAARAAFRERWLGRYLEPFADCAFLAVDPGGDVLGYIVGALADPARDPRFADIDYYRDLVAKTPRYPAHLHINLAASARNLGVGSRLLDAFIAHARAQGAPGIHAVTSTASRNRSFYARASFDVVAELDWNDHPIVMLGRAL